MDYQGSKEVVAFSAADHKHAALFFDKIVPLHSPQDVPPEIIWPFWEHTQKADVDLSGFHALRPVLETNLADRSEMPKQTRQFFQEHNISLPGNVYLYHG
jgi:hypothetical protein